MGAYICHHGIKGMKWGVRRFQNNDGSLTEAGERRYQHKVALSRPSEAHRYTYGPTAKPDQERAKKIRSSSHKQAKKIASQQAAQKRAEEDAVRRKANVQLAKDTADVAKRVSEQSKKDIEYKRKHKPRMDLSDKTTAELRDAINREKTEREYNLYFAPDNISKGRINVDKYLERAATAAGVIAVGVEVLDKIGFFDDAKQNKKK